jgi:DNA-binding response OmpR family regulator
VLASANNGRSAVAVAQEFRPEVILLDIGLPDIDGYEVCRRVRGESWGDEVEIIAVTGWGQDEARDKSSEAGFDHHLVKPIDHAVLAELLARAEDA